MEQTLLNYEQSKVLKELGFPQEDYSICVYHLNGDKPQLYYYGDNDYPYDDKECDAPTIEMAASWLREYKNIEPIEFIHLEPSSSPYQRWNYRVEDVMYEKYDDAMSAVINKAIEQLKKCH